MSKAEKTVLAFDTALGGVSVGVIANNGHVVSRMIETQREQASMLIPMIQEVLVEAGGLTLQDVDLIVSSVGPGSFTGIRIGLATARTLAMTLDIPVVGLVTLDVMARHYEIEYTKVDQPLLIVLETKRKDFYARYYDEDGVPLTEAFAADASVVLERAPVEGFSIGGDCLNRFQECVSGDFKMLDNLIHLDPILMAQYGLAQYEDLGGSEELGVPQPLYLRGADVSYPKNKPRKLAEV